MAQTPTVQEILARYPKTRAELPESYREVYEANYYSNRQGRTAASRLSLFVESWMHRQVARDTKTRAAPFRTLEVGAGTLNHLPFEPTSRPYDVVEPFEGLYVDSPYRDQIQRFYSDISHVPGPYERIISVATFEHLEDLPTMIAHCAELLTPDGDLRVAIPSEGSWVWKLAYTLSTGLEFRLRHGLSYETLMRHLHCNTWVEIRTLLEGRFRQVSCRCLGLSPAHSIYQFYSCREPR